MATSFKLESFASAANSSGDALVPYSPSAQPEPVPAQTMELLWQRRTDTDIHPTPYVTLPGVPQESDSDQSVSSALSVQEKVDKRVQRRYWFRGLLTARLLEAVIFETMSFDQGLSVGDRRLEDPSHTAAELFRDATHVQVRESYVRRGRRVRIDEPLRTGYDRLLGRLTPGRLTVSPLISAYVAGYSAEATTLGISSSLVEARKIIGDAPSKIRAIPLAGSLAIYGDPAEGTTRSGWALTEFGIISQIERSGMGRWTLPGLEALRTHQRTSGAHIPTREERDTLEEAMVIITEGRQRDADFIAQYASDHAMIGM